VLLSQAARARRAAEAAEPTTGARGAGTAGSGTAAAEPIKALLDEAGEVVSRAYHVCPNFEVLVEALLRGGLDALRER
jgi:DNA ligase-1